MNGRFGDDTRPTQHSYATLHGIAWKGELRCYCGYMIPITEEDLGFEELECPRCECTNTVPEKKEDLAEWNKQEAKEYEERRKADARYRIMLEGEDRLIHCLKDNLKDDDDGLLEIIRLGYQSQYPDGKVYIETMEDYMNLLHTHDYNEE